MAAPPAGGTGNIPNQHNSSGCTLESTPTGTGLAGLLTAAAGTGERYASLDDAELGRSPAVG